MVKWWAIDVDNNDWETKELIERHNLADALKSGLAIKYLEV